MADLPAKAEAHPLKPSSIKLLNWADYLSADLFEGFEAKIGIRVDETWIDSNDDFIARPSDEQMRAGTFLRDLGEFNATFERSYAKVRVL